MRKELNGRGASRRKRSHPVPPRPEQPQRRPLPPRAHRPASHGTERGGIFSQRFLTTKIKSPGSLTHTQHKDAEAPTAAPEHPSTTDFLNIDSFATAA